MALKESAARAEAQRADWRQQVVYQIYPRSFCDSNGDGIGDLPGITSKLDHLQALGVGVVWLSPVYASPNDDNGYDISDYRQIMAEFGTLADFDEMLAEMHARGIKLMMDLVVNHSSDEHAWFRQARLSRDNPFHDYYIWREPKPDGSPPTNWEAAFTGSVWAWNEHTGEYYLHMFSPKQPDLNWENPALRQEVYALMRFWLDRGVDGFRMDVINMISKPWREDGSLPDAPVVRPGFLQPGFSLTCNGPRLLEFLREMRAQVLDHYDTITVGEAPLATVREGVEITHPESGALSMLFQFEHMDLDVQPNQTDGKWAAKRLDLADLKATMGRWQEALFGQGWNSLYLSNHDQPRPVSRFGNDGEFRVRSAKLLGLWLHGLQGTPYVYQGEELGLVNVAFADISHYQDLETLNWYRVATTERGWSPEKALAAVHMKSRDNARTPMPWTSAPGAGFSSGTPWLALNERHVDMNAESARADPDSVFHFYRQLIALRRSEPLLTTGRYRLILDDHPQVYAYLREEGEGENLRALLVLANFSDESAAVNLPKDLAGRTASELIGNLGPARWAQLPATLTLAPWEGRWLALP
jgi:oligo-1,6-glucosidase